mmetsp:Transcript_66841/g.196206  ORF Transcript_66841/g.196206 Transcript_66841/m.196206 type:complete len:915 (-) Transcript_66841:209-2953(-)
MGGPIREKQRELRRGANSLKRHVQRFEVGRAKLVSAGKKCWDRRSSWLARSRSRYSGASGSDRGGSHVLHQLRGLRRAAGGLRRLVDVEFVVDFHLLVDGAGRRQQLLVKAALGNRPDLGGHLVGLAALQLDVAVGEGVGHVLVGLQDEAAVGAHHVVLVGDEHGVLVRLADVQGRCQVRVHETVPRTARRDVAVEGLVARVEGDEELQALACAGVGRLRARLRARRTGAARAAGHGAGVALAARVARAVHAVVHRVARRGPRRTTLGGRREDVRDEVVRVLPALVGPLDVLLGEELCPVEDVAMLLANGHDEAAEAHEARLLRGAVVPGEPVRRILAPGVVVPRLRATVLVAHEEHGGASREEERAQEIAHLVLPQLHDLHVLRLAVERGPGAAVPRVVLIVTTLLVVVPVVLLVVGHEVPQREAVVRRDEVDGVRRALAHPLVEVRAAADARGEVALLALVALEELAHVVAVLPVPLGPARHAAVGELADQVAIGPGAVPGLGDELHVHHHRVVHEPLHEERVDDVALPVLLRGVEEGALADEGGGEVEAEAVHLHVVRPVAEALADPLRAEGAVGVDRVAAPSVVAVVLAGHQVVVLLRDGGQRVPVALAPCALAGVVEHHVQDHLDAVAVQLADQRLELDDSSVVVRLRGEAVHGHVVRAGGVAPVVAQVLLGLRVQARAGGLVVLEDRQQLHAVDAHAEQVRDLLQEAAEGPGAVLPVVHAAVGVLRETAHMRLVDHKVLEVEIRLRDALPVERPHGAEVGHPGDGGELRTFTAVPGDGVRGVQHARAGIDDALGLGLERPAAVAEDGVEQPGVAAPVNLERRQHLHVPHRPGLVLGGNKLHEDSRPILLAVVLGPAHLGDLDEKPRGLDAGRRDGEVHAAGGATTLGDAVGQGRTAAQPQSQGLELLR